MSRPSNVCVVYDERIKSLNHLIKKFLRECKNEGVIREHLEQFSHETRGQKRRRLKREGRSRHLRDQKRKTKGRKKTKQ